jgi:chromosome segregation ATPase
MTEEKTIQELDARYQSLQKRREALMHSKLQIEAELSTRKRSLKEAMEECKKAGFNPDNLQEEIQRLKDVLTVKMDTFEADLDAAETAIKPMLREIA